MSASVISFFNYYYFCPLLPRFPTLSPLKSFPARPLLTDGDDLPRLIRWDDYEELAQSENVAPQKSSVMVRKKQAHLSPVGRLPKVVQQQVM